MANNLARLRTAAGLTQKELGRELGVHPRTINRWERGYSKIPPKRWRSLAKRFCASEAYLLGIDGNDQRDWLKSLEVQGL